MANRTITLVDNGDERYLIKADFTNLGRRYDNESEELTVIFPEFEREAEHACTMVVTHDNTNVDRILIADGTPVPIRNNLSQYTSVTIGFVFTDSNGYVKGSEKKQFPFLPAQSPEDFVPVDPDIEDDILFLIANAITKLGLSGNTLQGKNKAETVTTSVDLTAFKNTNIKFNDQVVEEVDANDFAAGIEMSLDTTTYRLTVNLVDGNDVVLSTKTVDLPSENAIVDASYNETTKKITFVLQSGNTFEVDVSSIVSGLIPDTRTIAGLRLNQDITASALRTALNVEDGASAFNENNVLAGTNISVSKSGKNVTISATDIPSNTSDLINDGDGESPFATQADIGDGTITITENGETVATFSVNQTSDTTINLTGGGGGGASSFDELTGDPYDNENLADALNSKLNKDTTNTYKLYGKGSTADSQMMWAIDQTGSVGHAIPQRDAYGHINVPTTPTSNSHATSKEYVDTTVANAQTNLYKIQGSETVANLNSATKTATMNGYVYNISVGGDLTNNDSSTVTAIVGDNVVLVWNSGSWYWDKLAGDIDLSSYVQKTTTIAGVDLQDNITASELGTALIDGSSITENSSDKIQAVGVIGTNGLISADTIDTGLTIQIYEAGD